VSQTRASYHHGSLREVLVRACLDLIRAEGIGAVSLRRVAREAGVSPGAPYHHFADRAALLTTISVQGSELLEKRLRAARSAAPTPVAALAALVETYVRFAHEQPGYFHLTCRPELAKPEGGEWTCQVLYEVVVDCQREGTVPAGQPGPIIGMVWAIAHGSVGDR
jgi:AcrR family transcriptional regulator